jgi:TetR/AcrR family transcriptional regulator
MNESRRGRERDAATARQAILAAAEEVFARHGYAGARIDAIAEEAGYNKSLIFQYFQSKEHLYIEVITCIRGNIDEYLATILAETEDNSLQSRENLRTFFAHTLRTNFQMFIERPNLRRILAWEAASGWQTYHNEHMVRKAEFFTRLIKRAQASGMIRSDIDPPTLFNMVITIGFSYLNSLPRFQRLFPETDIVSDAALKQAQEQIITLILDGVMTPSSLGDLDATGI